MRLSCKLELNKWFFCVLHKARAILIRQQDREQNDNNYPSLTYPDIEILIGGYSSFYNSFNNYCKGGYVTEDSERQTKSTRPPNKVVITREQTGASAREKFTQRLLRKG